MRRFRIKPNILACLILGAGGLASPIWAQSYETGGIQLRFGLGLGVDARSNRSLDPDDPGETIETKARLSLGLLTQTQQQSFSFGLGGTLRNISGDGAKTFNNGFINPSASMAYSRESASARLKLDASVIKTDLADQDNLIFDEETNTFIIVSGNATRVQTKLSGSLNWRDDAPLGFGVLARYEESDYSGGVATGVGGTSLEDSERLTFGATSRLELNETTRLNSSLTYSTYKKSGKPGSRETISLENGIVVDHPNGSIGADLGLTNTEEGNRITTSIGRSYEMPLTTFSGRIGVTRGVSGDYFMVGSLGATRALPRGNLNATLNHSVSSSNEQDEEQINTSLRLGYLHELSELSNMNFSVSLSRAESESSGLSTTNASFTASYSRQMTQDWNMNMGVRHRIRDDDKEGDTNSNEVFLNLSRDFVTRF